MRLSFASVSYWNAAVTLLRLPAVLESLAEMRIASCFVALLVNDVKSEVLRTVSDDALGSPR